MTVNERSRFELYERLEQVIGEEAATTLLEHLPPAGWADVATKRDLDQLEQRVDARLESFEQRVGARFQSLEQLVDARFDASEQRLLAAFRGELVAAVTAQTRATIFALLGTVVSLGGLALAASALH